MNYTFTSLQAVICLLFGILFGCSSYNSDRTIDESSLDIDGVFEFDRGRLFRLSEFNDLLYVSHGPNFTVSSFTIDGEHVRDYGKKGDELWENGSIWGFFPDTLQGKYWLHDYSKQLIKSFRMSDDSLMSHRKIISNSNVLWVGRDRFLIPTFAEADNEFFIALTDVVKDTILHRFNIVSLLPDVETSNLAQIDYVFTGGFAISPSNQKALYYTLYTGRAFLIDLKTLNVQVLEDFRELPFPTSTIRENEIVLDPEYYSFLSAAVDSSYIYIMSPERLDTSLNNNEYYIDKYDYSGQYLESIYIPKLNDDIPRHLAKTTKGFAIAYANGTIGTFNYL